LYYPEARMIYYSKNNFVKSRRNPKSGFTLVELLLIITLLSVVSLAMYAVLNNGVKIWQRINRQLPQEDVAIFLDKFSRDLRNSFKFSGVAFSGREENLMFATIVNSPRLQRATVGRAAYFYDAQAMTLIRQQDDYSQISGGEAGLIQSLGNVKSAKFGYYIFDQENKQYFWRQEWTGDNLPITVSIEMEIQDGSQIRKIMQRVDIPVAG
jgi:hypothetical protein